MYILKHWPKKCKWISVHLKLKQRYCDRFNIRELMKQLKVFGVKKTTFWHVWSISRIFFCYESNLLNLKFNTKSKILDFSLVHFKNQNKKSVLILLPGIKKIMLLVFAHWSRFFAMCYKSISGLEEKRQLEFLAELNLKQRELKRNLQHREFIKKIETQRTSVERIMYA